MTAVARHQLGSPAGGFFDLQVNGFGGIDFQDPALTETALRQAAVALKEHQTDRILLTLITDRVDALCSKLERIERCRERDNTIATTIAGYHLEGPYLLAQPGFSGAHDARLMHAPKISEFELLWEAAQGRIRLVTLAPELPGSAAFIAHLASLGVRVAAGHTDAGDACIDEAIAAGLTLCTHLGNGVPLQLHRHDNVIQRLLARDELYAAFIPDGIHLPRGVLRNLVRAKPADRVLFTTDAMAAAGAGPGTFRLGGLVTEVGADGVVRQPGAPQYFAGSSLTMDAAAANVERMVGWPRAQAERACGTAVAAYLGY